MTATGEAPDELGTVRAAAQELFTAYTAPMAMVGLLTLMVFIAAPPPSTFTATRALAAVGILLAPWIKNEARYWTVLTALAVTGTLREPFLDLDNHHVLILYWLAAVTAASWSRAPRATLRTSARLLIGLVFAFATLWKVVTPDFVDGTFLTYAISTDTNLERVAVSSGLQEPETAAVNGQAIRGLRNVPTAPLEPVELTVDDGTARFAPLLSWATILLEATVALTFLLPLPMRWRWMRDGSLIVFIASVYVALPVFGFGALLAVMGLAASDLPERPALLTYLLTLIALVAAVAIVLT